MGASWQRLWEAARRDITFFEPHALYLLPKNWSGDDLAVQSRINC